MIRVLIGYSTCPHTRRAFELAGCEAWTCDLFPARSPEDADRHLQCDVWEVLKDRWDAAVLHPMCTYLTVAAAWAFRDPDFERWPGVGYHQRPKPGTLTGAARREAREVELENFRRLLELPYPKAIENPADSFAGTAIRSPDQRIHPHQFGDDASKKTGLWLDRLPKLKPTGFAPGRVVSEDRDLFGHGVMRWSNQSDAGQNRLTPGDERWLQRSATYPGIAAAMGAQWGAFLRRA